MGIELSLRLQAPAESRWDVARRIGDDPLFHGHPQLDGVLENPLYLLLVTQPRIRRTMIENRRVALILLSVVAPIAFWDWNLRRPMTVSQIWISALVEIGRISLLGAWALAAHNGLWKLNADPRWLGFELKSLQRLRLSSIISELWAAGLPSREIAAAIWAVWLRSRPMRSPRVFIWYAGWSALMLWLGLVRSPAMICFAALPLWNLAYEAATRPAAAELALSDFYISDLGPSELKFTGVFALNLLLVCPPLWFIGHLVFEARGADAELRIAGLKIAIECAAYGLLLGGWRVWSARRNRERIFALLCARVDRWMDRLSEKGDAPK